MSNPMMEWIHTGSLVQEFYCLCLDHPPRSKKLPDLPGHVWAGVAGDLRCGVVAEQWG